jgi:hypothetical protein
LDIVDRSGNVTGTKIIVWMNSVITAAEQRSGAHSSQRWRRIFAKMVEAISTESEKREKTRYSGVLSELFLERWT